MSRRSVPHDGRGTRRCPAPLIGAVAANLALATQSSNAARAALASEASGQRGNSITRAPDTRPEPRSSARALLADLHQGNASIAPALGGFDGDPAAGHVVIRGDPLQGSMSFVEGAQAATHLLIFTDTPAGVAGTGQRTPMASP
jgi:hypothetical protein